MQCNVVDINNKTKQGEKCGTAFIHAPPFHVSQTAKPRARLLNARLRSTRPAPSKAIFAYLRESPCPTHTHTNYACSDFRQTRRASFVITAVPASLTSGSESRVEVSRDSKDARALVDAVIAAIDEPRALTGRDRRGGAVLIFKAGMGVNNSRREFALRGGEEIVITFGSEGYTLDPNLFQWPKGRGVLDVRAMRFRRCSRSLQKSRTMQHGLPARDVRRNSNRSVRTPPGWTNSGPTSRPVK